MVQTFPTGLFGFLEQEVDIERQTLKGGTALSGEQDVVSADGGGRVFAEFAAGSLVDRDKILAWRALLGVLEEGVTRIVVPFCDPRHTPYGGRRAVPHSDGTPFSDGSLYIGGGPVAINTAIVNLRGTSLAVVGVFTQPLIGGEWFTIEHPTKGARAYKVRSVEPGEVAGVTIVSFVPPLREAVAAGAEVDFATPRCVMVQDGRASSRLQNRRYTEAAIRFIEAPN
jgi:hypothetical protein